MNEFGIDLDALANKLDSISATLTEILEEQRKTNVAFENIGDEISFTAEHVCRELDEVHVDELSEKVVLFAGFRKKDVKNFVQSYAGRKHKLYKYIPSIDSMSDFAAIVTNCIDNTVLLIDCGGITKSQNLISGMTDTIDDGCLSVQIGKGAASNQVQLDIPNIQYMFFETTCFYVPRTLRDGIDICIWQEEDKKRDQGCI